MAKSVFVLKHALAWLLLGGLLFTAPPALARSEAANADFTGWHLPVPAGLWRISQGPCGSAARYNHACGYYEDRCAIDLVPAFGSMEDAPVLAPQAGRVFFLGRRQETGLMLMLRHADGRVSALMHLSRVVVSPDEPVTQGQVVAYAGSTGSSGNPHLHFFVQPNAVERECLDLKGLDDLDFKLMTATSRNLAWPQLTLPDPPAALPGWLPALAASPRSGDAFLPQSLLLAPGASITLPVTVAAPAVNVLAGGRLFAPTRRTLDSAWFSLPLAAPLNVGQYEQMWQLYSGARGSRQTITLLYSVRPAPVVGASLGLILVSPSVITPTGYSVSPQPPVLCWRVPASAGEWPFHFRILVVGPQSADSGWITPTCWRPSALKPGTYYWKVFVRDGRGYMNRTNQRPSAFVIR